MLNKHAINNKATNKTTNIQNRNEIAFTLKEALEKMSKKSLAKLQKKERRNENRPRRSTRKRRY